MKLEGPSSVRLSATDLANHLACHHLTASNFLAQRGEIEPPPWTNPILEAIRQRGMEHEARYLDRLREEGLELDEAGEADGAGSRAGRTLAAMRAGAPVIVQATLEAEGWLGIADVLLRVERPSELGAWSYEVVDTKLARETAGGTILQLCLYSELVERYQGLLPESMHVVSPGSDFAPESYRVEDYLAYYRLVKGRLEGFVAGELGGAGAETYPEPCSHCEICRWWPVCDRRRRADDHLSLVAGISKLQRRELEARGVDRLEALAWMPMPLEWKPTRGSVETYERVRKQAAVQLRAREEKRPVHELLPLEEGRGLARLPRPSRLDVFFDIEGDPFAGEGGREYLFGYAARGEDGEVEYRGDWAFDAGEERRMFERFMAEMMDRWAADPDFHIYHYAPYEPATLKRLMGRYATCEEEIDRMLRAKVFVDLYSVTRQAVLAGVESYSIKKLEPLFGYAREEELGEVRRHLAAVERALELGEAEGLPAEVLRAVETYNKDDCLATLGLRDWLESERAGLVAGGETVERPAVSEGEATEQVEERRLEAAELAARLLADVPDEPGERDEAQRARWRLAHLLEWHWREEKVNWWEYFRLRDLDEEELFEERAGVSGLVFEEEVGGTARCPVHRYSYPLQEVRLKRRDLLYQGDRVIGEVVAVESAARRFDVKKREAAKDVHPEAVFVHRNVRTKVQARSMLRFGNWVADHGFEGEGSYRAARDLLLARPPRFAPGAAGLEPREGEETVEFARRLALELDEGTLPVQGPPGSGKTYCGARMICGLVAAGKRVGVTANSHKVIRNLLREVVAAAAQEEQPLACVQKVRERSESEPEGILETTDNAEPLAALEAGAAQVAAGTAWMWSREEYFESVDVLVVDEAGQMSLANALAVAQAGRSLILLGDPQQLEQPQKGSHPEGAEVSALEHILGEEETIADERGLFLPETWRLHPAISAFTSEVFYDGRLGSRPGLERQELAGTRVVARSGLWYVPVEHAGNRSSSPEEVEAVARLVEQLTGPGAAWTNKEGRSHPIALDKILIVAPYNAQVALLAERLGPDARVGTVDRFQGQERPVVIYSMTTSSAEEAPRGMEFLYSPNRLNVATSRARCACVLVGSPRLFEPDCRSPRQMRLANAFCRYLEMAAVAG